MNNILKDYKDKDNDNKDNDNKDNNNDNVVVPKRTNNVDITDSENLVNLVDNNYLNNNGNGINNNGNYFN